MIDIITSEIEQQILALFPHGAGRASHAPVQHALEAVAQKAFQQGKSHALLGLMTAQDVAGHFGVSPRRARALIRNRHERFGVGMRVGREWLVHRDELPILAPDERYRS